ncbi:hypothetical protein ACFV0R_02610 [Streptomyces sp. NPDC059578]|uniref:hypothetical protein n=1 Tax=unclassified Streptomyces TaxID=2593676 RepID=UPI00364D1ACD
MRHHRREMLDTTHHGAALVDPVAANTADRAGRAPLDDGATRNHTATPAHTVRPSARRPRNRRTAPSAWLTSGADPSHAHPAGPPPSPVAVRRAHARPVGRKDLRRSPWVTAYGGRSARPVGRRDPVEPPPAAPARPERTGTPSVDVPPGVPQEAQGCLYALSQPPLMIFLTVIGTLLMMGAVHDLFLLGR